MVLFLLVSGCAPCGGYEISNTLATDYYGEDFNGHWKERCGSSDATSGMWDSFADGWSSLSFRPGASGDRDWLGLHIEIDVTLPTAGLVVGRVIEVDELGGTAALNPCISCRQDEAFLTSGTIEVVGGFDGDDPCAEEEGPVFRLRWDLVFGEDGGPLYEAYGTDQVLFSTFVSDACPDPVYQVSRRTSQRALR